MYFIYKSLTLSLVSCISGILIDIDHVFDYYIQKGITFKIREIYMWHIKNRYEFLFLYLHSLELLILLWAVIVIFKLGFFWIALAVGLTQHMALDIIFNPIHSYAYLFSYRAFKGFKKEHMLKSY